MQRNRQLIALIALLAVLAAVAIYQLRATSDGGGAGPAATTARRSAADRLSEVPAVRLDALQAARGEPEADGMERNPFLFKPKPLPPPPPPPKPGTPGSGLDAAGNPIPPPPPPPPPIPLKFIGIVQAPGQKLAVLSDNATKDVFSGREGEIIDGRYRIVRIGVESIEMMYLDGRGRQTIRLTGS